MQTRRALGGLLCLLLLAWSAILGCREEVPPLFRRNRPPETTLTVVAEDSTAAFYRYHVYWRGEDPDGEVVRFLFAITDTLNRDEEQNWDPSLAVDRERGVYTTKSDSIFLFDSNAGRQVINIVAIDDYGEMDPSPARSYFRVVDNGLPRVHFLDVISSSTDPRVLPCASADACTIPTFTNFQIRFVGTSANGDITGYTWQQNLDPWEPYFTVQDTFFLPVTDIQGDTMGTDQDGRKRWRLSEAHDSLTVYMESSRERPIAPGNFAFRVRVRDSARRTSLLDDGFREVTVNYDPDTHFYMLPECDCPYPPPGCSATVRVPVGFLTGVGLVDSFAIEDWQVFCPGDTLPLGARVRFYANGVDDARDLPLDPGVGLQEVTYRFAFEYGATATGPTLGAPGSRFSSTNMPFSDPASPARDLPVPPAAGSGTFRGAGATWRTCPFDYKAKAGAVDENGKLDGTEDSLVFYVSGTPVIDSLGVPKVLVFVPRCPDILPFMCPWGTAPAFGPDTLVVVGTQVPDTSVPPATPFGIGFNDFTFPFYAWGHDHPRDRNGPNPPFYYDAQTTGRIRSWRYVFDCTAANCSDYSLPGEGLWREDIKAETDPPGQDVFDDVLRVRIILDTLCTVSTVPCPARSARAILKFDRFGAYEFAIEGRDTEFIGQSCTQPSDLGRDPSTFPIPISDLGRTTQVARQGIQWWQYAQVRRVTKPLPAGKAAGPFAIPKRLMP